MILVTGATGFVGSHVVETLVNEGLEVLILVRNASDLSRVQDLKSRLHIFNIDTGSFDNVFSRYAVDTIIHLATYYKKEDREADIEAMNEVNFEFPKQLLNAGIKAGVKRFINTNSYFQYSPTPVPISCNNDENPFNNYAKSKIKFKRLLKKYTDQITIVNFILFTPYGPGDNHKLVRSVISAALLGHRINLSDGFQKIDLVYVRDVAKAYLAAHKSSSFELGSENAICIGSGFPVSIRDIVSAVEEICACKIDKKWGGASSSDYSLVYADIESARKKLGWVPQTQLRAGIKITFQSLQQEFSL